MEDINAFAYSDCVLFRKIKTKNKKKKKKKKYKNLKKQEIHDIFIKMK